MMKNKLTLVSLGIGFLFASSQQAFSQCNNSGIGTLLPNAKLEIRGCGTTSVTAAFKVTNSTDTTTTPILFLRNDKRVGIGLDNPSQTLEVAGTIFSNTGGFKFPDGTTQTTAAQIASGTLTINKIVTSRITSPDSVINFGDSSIIMIPNQNRIYALPNAQYKGLGIGINSIGFGNQSIVLGRKLTTASNTFGAMVIGGGSLNTGSFLTNNISNSLMIGFDSNIPTVFVGQSSGDGTTGKVGIATSSPIQTLDVNGRIHISNGVIQRGGSAITSTSDLGLYSMESGFFMRFVTNNAPIRFYSDGNPLSNNQLLTIESNGNVGIGTTSAPSAKFQVVSTSATGAVFTTNHSTDYSFGVVSEVNRNLTKAFAVMNNGSQAFVVYGDGRVGIAGADPDGDSNIKLSVCGQIKCKKIRVESSWCDYVFAKEYKLMPLEELEKFYSLNKHLPEYQPENEIIANGLDIGATSVLHQKSIEEIYLYLVDLKKTNSNLEKEIEELKKQIEAIKK